MIEISPVLKKIIQILEDHKLEYDQVVHFPVYTSEDAASIRDTAMDTGAKAIIFEADGEPILIVVPGSCKIDVKKFKKEHRIKDLRMMTPEKITEITGLEIGSIPPFGPVMGLKTYFDDQLAQEEWIAFNAGSHTHSVRMKATDFLKVCEVEVGCYRIVVE